MSYEVRTQSWGTRQLLLLLLGSHQMHPQSLHLQLLLPQFLHKICLAIGSHDLRDDLRTSFQQEARCTAGQQQGCSVQLDDFHHSLIFNTPVTFHPNVVLYLSFSFWSNFIQILSIFIQWNLFSSMWVDFFNEHNRFAIHAIHYYSVHVIHFQSMFYFQSMLNFYSAQLHPLCDQFHPCCQSFIHVE
jgi:hypothetical protein